MEDPIRDVEVSDIGHAVSLEHRTGEEEKVVGRRVRRSLFVSLRLCSIDGCLTPLPTPAVRDYPLILARLLEHVLAREIPFVHGESFGEFGQGQVYCGGDRALDDFVRFANVWDGGTRLVRGV